MTWRRAGMAAIALGVLLMMVGVVSPYLLGRVGFTQQEQVYLAHRSLVYLHIATASLALLLGPLQFSTRIRARYLSLHRWSGRVYLVGALLGGGLTGLYMAWISFGGFAAHVGFTGMALLTMLTGVRAYISIRSGNQEEHRRWMYRNYALIFAAVTIRLWIGLLSAFAGGDFPGVFAASIWLGWIVNLLFVEWVLVRRTMRGEVAAGRAAALRGRGA